LNAKIYSFYSYLQVFCVASVLIERLIELDVGRHRFLQLPKTSPSSPSSPSTSSSIFSLVAPEYVAFHIRRGDFQQTQTRLSAEAIVRLTRELVPDRSHRIAYIATDETNRTFFQPFFQEYK